MRLFFLFVLVFIFGFLVVLTDVQVGAVATVVGLVAADLWRSEVFAIFGSSVGLHPKVWEDIDIAVDVLGGDLEAVKEEPGAARVEFGGAQGVQDLGKGHLDGAAVFEDGELERLVGVWGLFGFPTVKARVEVAKMRATQGWRVTPVTIGHDVTTHEMHETPPPPLL